MDLVNEVLTFSRDYVNGNQTQERRKKIAAAYKSLFNENLRIGCGTCYIEAIFKIKKKMEKKVSNYLLKPGALLRTFGDESKTCTNANLTDELAEWHLSHNPGVIRLFSKIPGKVNLPTSPLTILPVNKEYLVKPEVKELTAKKEPEPVAKTERPVFPPDRVEKTILKAKSPRKAKK